METNNDLPHFLNCLDVIGVLTGGEYSSFNKSKKIIIDNFRDIDFEELIILLNFIDDLHNNFLRQDFNSNPLTNILRDKIFAIYDNKMAEERLYTANKPITLKNIS